MQSSNQIRVSARRDRDGGRVPLRRASALFGAVRRCSALFGAVRRCSALFGSSGDRELVNCEQPPRRRSPPTDGEFLGTLGDDGPPEP
jgi:hypothetical protein